MNRFLRTAPALAALTMTALLAGPAAPAVAAPSPGASARASAGAGLDAAKQAVTGRIDKRLDTLEKLNAAVSGAKHLGEAHKATLTKLIADDRAGLTALRAKAAGETTGAALREDAQRMVHDYRIYLLVAP